MRAFAASLVVLAACARPVQPRPLPDDVGVSVSAALAAGATAAHALAPLAGEGRGCAAMEVLASTLDGASKAVLRATTPGPLLPALVVDVTACGPLGPDVEVPDLVFVGLRLASDAVEIAASLSPDPCAGEWVDASLTWALGATLAVLDEVDAQDGVVLVEAVPVDLTACWS